MPRPGFVLDVDRSTPPILFWRGENFSLEKLPADQFARVHRSYIVNLSRCNALDRHQVQLGKHQIPIGRGYREALFARLADLG